MTFALLDTTPTIPPLRGGFFGFRDAETRAAQLKAYSSLPSALSTRVSVLRQPKGILPPSKANPWKCPNET